MDELSSRLIRGGYPETTPAAVVYKASWEDEKIVTGTVKEYRRACASGGDPENCMITVDVFLEMSLSFLSCMMRISATGTGRQRERAGRQKRQKAVKQAQQPETGQEDGKWQKKL